MKTQSVMKHVVAMASTTLAVLALTLPALAVVVDNFTIDVTGYFAISDCPDINPIFITGGFLHMQDHITVNGNTVHIGLQENSESIEGYDIATGARYNVIVNSTDTSNFAVSGFPAEETFTETFNLIGQEGAPNEVGKITTHITINANGSVTVDRVDFTIDCK